jgi:hypothetical protein
VEKTYQIRTSAESGSDGRVTEGIVEFLHDLVTDAGTCKGLAIGMKRRKTAL